jgi:hypothetical protein
MSPQMTLKRRTHGEHLDGAELQPDKARLGVQNKKMSVLTIAAADTGIEGNGQGLAGKPLRAMG